MFQKDRQYIKFSTYGFLKNLRFFEPFLILYFLEAGISFFQIGILFTIRAVTINILEIPSGMIADGIGRRRAMLISFASYILSFLTFYFLPRYVYFIPAMLLFAFGEAFRTGTHKAMILDYLRLKGWEGEKINYYGHTRSWSQRGSALSALLAAALIFYSGNYRSVFLFTLIPYSAELLLMLSYPAELDGPGGRDAEQNLKVFIRSVYRGISASLKSPKMRHSFLNSSIAGGYFQVLKDYIQPLLASLALTLPFATGLIEEKRTALVTGVIFSLIYLLTSLASGYSGRISGRLGSVRRQLNGSYLLAMGLVTGTGLLYHKGYLLPAVILYMGCYFLENFRRPPAVGYLSDQIDPALMATVLSTDSQLKTLWVAILAPLVGWAADTWSPGTALAATGLLGILLLPFARIPSEKRTSSAQP